jgi:methyl-accepting chemotaxis protein
MKKLLSNLSLNQKFGMVIVAMCVPLVLMLYLLITDSSDSINFSSKEIQGAEYNQAVVRVLRVATQHRGLSNTYLSGNENVRGKLDATAKEVEKYFSELEAMDNRYGESLQSTEDFKKLREEWNKLVANHLNMSAAESLAGHNNFVSGLIRLITHVGDTSNLILDPDLDSFYLMNVVTVIAPTMLDEMGKMRATGAGILARGSVTSQEREKLRVLDVTVQKSLDGFRHSIEAVYAKTGNANIKINLDETQKAFRNEVDKFLGMVKTQIFDADNLTASSTVYFEQATRVIDSGYKLYDLILPELTGLLNARIENLQNTRNLQLGVVVVFVALALILVLTVTRGITNGLGHVVNVFNQMAGGRLDNEIDIETNDEVGQVQQALKTMQTKLKKNIEDNRKRAGEMARVKSALDVATANIMVADINNNIVYVNAAANSMFSKAEQDIARDIPGFGAAGLIGANIDKFHKNPMHQRNLLAHLNGTHRAGFVVGGRHMNFIANPVFGESGERLGTVVEWQDRTAEVAVENEVASIVSAARQGDLQQRIAETDKNGFFLQIAKGVNEMIDVVAESMNDIATIMAGMSQGDLTHTINRDYSGRFGEVKDSVNLTIEKLNNTITQIRDTSDFIRTSSEEISAGNNNLSQRAEQQASALEETASSMEELTSTVKNNAENAVQANQLSVNARNLAEKGGSVVHEAVEAMDAITRASHKIAEIISVIDEIAFQTNLLALNASVEAARAGDQGRGFAVVASEVRNLAQRSAAAAKEIKDLIHDSENKVMTGSKLVNDSGATLKEIVDAVKKVTDIISEIAAASREQAAGIEEVNRAVTQMDEITQQNAALAEQASASSESSLQKATEMANLVQFFRTT